MAITYCIVCNITGEKYYGSSTKTLEQRLKKHKHTMSCACNKIIERGNYEIYQLGKYETIEEAEMKEDWYIRNKECINKQRVIVTKEEVKEYQKEWYQKNKYKLLEYHKDHYEINREKYLESGKKSYQKRKDKILEKLKEKVECEFCRCIYSRSSLKRHQRSKKCLQLSKENA